MKLRHYLALILLAGILLILTSITAYGRDHEVAKAGEPYNIVLIYTDDQRWDTVCGETFGQAELCALPPQDHAMPMLESLMAQSVVFANAVVTNPACCPSRADFLSGGFYSHHTNVLANNPPNGGAPAFVDTSSLPVYLQQAGYKTALIGKYLNFYEETMVDPENNRAYIPPGWNQFFVSYSYTPDWMTMLQFVVGSSTFSQPGLGRLRGANDIYLTDAEGQLAIRFINQVCPGQSCASPFFMAVTHKAPHPPAVPAARHEDLFNGYTFRGRGWGEDDFSDKPQYVEDRAGNYDPIFADEFNRDQLRTLRAVDESLAAIYTRLQQKELLDNTIFIFTSDNGFMWGEHNLTGKQKPYEESIRVPLIILMPGVAGREDNTQVAADIDLGATILDLAGVPPIGSDGLSLLPLLENPALPWRQDLLLEAVSQIDVPTWSAVRTQDNWKYVEYATGERELYDLNADPFELGSRHDDPAYADEMADLDARLDALQPGIAIQLDNLPDPQLEVLPAAALGQFYSFTLQASGGNGLYLWRIQRDPDLIVCNDELPTGLELTSTGVLSGTPTESGVFSVCVQVEDTSDSPQPGNDQPQIYIEILTLVVADSPPRNDTTPLPLSAHGTIEMAGVIAPYLGDDNQNGTAILYYRATGSPDWLEGHRLSRDADFDEWRGSLFYLQPDTAYDLELRFDDPDGVSTSVVSGTVQTRPDYPVIGSGGVTYTVPLSGSLEQVLDLVQPGDTVQLLSGVYTGTLLLTAAHSGLPGQYLTLEAAPGEAVVFDGSDPAINGPEDNWTFFQSSVNGDVYYADLPWGDQVCSTSTMLPNYVGELVDGDGKRYLQFDSLTADFDNDFLPSPAGKSYYVCSLDGPGPVGRLYVVTYDGDDPDNHEMHLGRHRIGIQIQGADYLRLRGFEVRYYNMTGIKLEDDGVTGADNNIIENMTIHGIGEWHLSLEPVLLEIANTDNLIQNNTIYEHGYRESGWVWDVEYQIGRGDTSAIWLSNVGPGNVVRGNTITGGHDAINVERASSNTDIYNNTIHECMDNGIQVTKSPGPNNRVWNNTLNYCFSNLVHKDWHDAGIGPVYLFRNVIVGGNDPLGRKDYLGGDRGYDTHRAYKLGGFATHLGELFVYNNTFVITLSAIGNKGIALDDAGGPIFANATATNNIWAVTGRVYDFDANTGTVNQTFDCNNLYDANPTANTMIVWGDTGGPASNGNYTSLAEFQSYTGQDLNSISDMGSLFDPEMRLLPGSPEIDAGCVITGFSDRGPDATVGTAPDMGAYESD